MFAKDLTSAFVSIVVENPKGKDGHLLEQGPESEPANWRDSEGVMPVRAFLCLKVSVINRDFLFDDNVFMASKR